MQVGLDALAAVVGPVVLLAFGLEGEGWSWNTLFLVCHILLVMLYPTLMCYAICSLLIYLFSNLLKHL